MTLRKAMMRYKFHHLLLWMLVGAIWYYLRYQDYSTAQKAFFITLVKVTDLALLVYTANYLLIPKLLYRKKFGLFSFTLISLIVVSSIAKLYVIGAILNNPGLTLWANQLKTRIYDNVIPHFFLVTAGMSFKLWLDYNQVQTRLLQTAKEKAETELAFLKSQINPHFLFNSLNAVYFLIDKNNTAARSALHTFSDMLRYQLYDVDNQKVSIGKEVDYLKDYMGLQQLRKENCNVEVNFDPTLNNVVIEPFLLLPFVENAFKHLSHYSNGKQNEVHLFLSKEKDGVQFCIRNTTEPQSGNEPGGIGLSNVKRRLQLLYPTKHQLQIQETEGWFTVYLTLKTEPEWHPSVALS